MEGERTQMRQPEGEDLTAALERVEAAVRAGNTDLRALGFWRLVGQIKRDPALIERHADQVGRIDTIAFRSRVRVRVPVWTGNTMMLIAIAFGMGALWVSARTEGASAGLAFLVAGLSWSLGVHSPTHWVTGRLAGIRFTDYFLGGPPPPRPGLKTDYSTYLRAEPSARAWFHASGAIATKLAPFATIALWPLTAAPGWAAWVLAGYGVLQIVTDLLFSVRSSDWKKFRRERAVARTRR